MVGPSGWTSWGPPRYTRVGVLAEGGTTRTPSSKSTGSGAGPAGYGLFILDIIIIIIIIIIILESLYHRYGTI